MNVPSKSSYQSTCVTRTVQSIDKFKQKNAGIKKCLCYLPPPPCIVPTLSGVTATNTQTGVQYTVTLTGSPTTVQWWYMIGEGNAPFVDNPPSVSGSQTTQLILNTSFYNGKTIFCLARNPCNPSEIFPSIVSGYYKIGCGPYPTVGNILRSNCRPSSDPVYTTRCDYTVQYSNGTSFQWYYGAGQIFRPFALVDDAYVSGSQTPTVSLNTTVPMLGCGGIQTIFYCIVTNSCGSTQSNNSADLLDGCPQVVFPD